MEASFHLYFPLPMMRQHFFFFHRVNLILHFIHRNGDGFVDREEFGDILHMTGENVTEEDIDEMFGESDTNKDGKIDFDGKMRLHVEGGFSSVLWTTHAVSSIMSVELSGRRTTDRTSRSTSNIFEWFSLIY